MDTDPAVNSSPSACKLGIKAKSNPKMVDEGTSVEAADFTGQDGAKEIAVDQPSLCHTDCSTWHPPKVPPRHGFCRIGKYGLGAWRMGNVPSDVILDKV